ncbi:MAG: type II secretion system F family protein [Candidatus Moranbacteria bacterium]|nr:type II secretion system F family protein [Candidatus Moranbacteria bacterium]
MRFVFKAKDAEGKMKEGLVEAMTQETAVQVLQKSGLTPVSVEREDVGNKFVKSFRKMWESVTHKELVVLFRQLATLIEAKVPLVTAISAIEAQTENKYLRIILKEMVADINDGMVFSEAMMKHPDTFSSLTINMIKAGEISGSLRQSITYVANDVEKNYQLNAKIKSALFYPAFVLAVAGVIGFVVVSFILPKLTVLIRDMNVATPWYTQVVMSLGDFMSEYWWAVALLIFAFIGSAIYYIKGDVGKKEWQRLELKIPVVGKLLRYVYLARMTDTFSTLLTGGIPMVRALIITGDVVENAVFKSILLRSADEVKSGGSISTVFARSEDIPPVVTQMVRIGEETGKLGEVLEGTARFYDQEVDYITKNLTSLLEPILIVGLGIGVSILVFSIILPIYNIAGQI